MGVKWIKTRHQGVRYYNHPTRKHGVQNDKYFAIRYQRDGKRREEGLGWSSEGWTAKKAALELAELKKAHLFGNGPTSLAEKRQLEEERRQAEQTEVEKQEKESITFGQFFEKKYLPIAETTKKPDSVRTEKGYFKNWLQPVVGNMPFKDIYPLHFERMKKNMLKKERAPRSIQYCLAIGRQVWNQARRDGFTDRESPTKGVKLPKIDNKRIRFLTHDEADRLLNDLVGRSLQLHDISLLSLHTGMRAGEIFNLKWASVDTDQGLIYIIDAKWGSRTGHMTDEVKQMFKRQKRGGPNDLVFEDRKGNQIKEVSRSFDRAVDHLGFNNGVTDRRQKVLFHTLRHTFASWLVQQGEPLYTVQKLMGHASIAMTERYSHLAPDNLKAAVKNFEKSLNDKRAEKQKVVKLKKQKYKPVPGEPDAA